MSANPWLVSFHLIWYVLPAQGWGQPPMLARGGATLFADQCYQMTSEDSSHQVSALWSSVPVHFDNSFDLRFMVYMGCEAKGGEGMAFVMHGAPDSTRFLGCPDNALGYAPSLFYFCDVPIPSFSVEIDTRFDGYARSGEINADHLALCKNGNFLSPLLPPTPLYSPQGSIKDCNYHAFRIAWKPSEKMLRVWFDDELKITYYSDLRNEFFNGQPTAWFGFTGSTGDVASTQMLCVRAITLEIDEVARENRRFQDGVFLLPLPDEDKIGLDFDFDKTQSMTITVYTLQGTKVRTERLSGVTRRRHDIAMRGLKSGIYYVSITNGRSRVAKKVLYIAQPKA